MNYRYNLARYTLLKVHDCLETDVKLKTWFTVAATALTVFAAQAQEMSDDEIADRIKPIGQVHVAGAQAAGNNAQPAVQSQAKTFTTLPVLPVTQRAFLAHLNCT